MSLIQNQYQIDAFAVQCDVGCAEQVKALAEQAEQLMGHATTLIVNNAGVGLGGKFDEVSLEDWQLVVYACQFMGSNSWMPLFCAAI